LIPEDMDSVELAAIKALQKTIPLLFERLSTIEDKVDRLLTRQNKQYIEVGYR